MSRCDKCKHALMDFAEGYGGGFWFVEDCDKDKSIEADECDEYEEMELIE